MATKKAAKKKAGRTTRTTRKPMADAAPAIQADATATPRQGPRAPSRKGPRRG